MDFNISFIEFIKKYILLQAGLFLIAKINWSDPDKYFIRYFTTLKLLFVFWQVFNFTGNFCGHFVKSWRKFRVNKNAKISDEKGSQICFSTQYYIYITQYYIYST